MATEETRLKGLLGGQAASKLAKHRDIETVGDLLAFAPRRYRTAEADLGHPAVGDFLVAVARVESASTRQMAKRRGRMLEATITDGRSHMRVTFFDARGHEHKLVAGRELLFAGTVSQFRGQTQLAHPGYATLEEAAALGELGDASGYGQTPEQARAIVVPDAGPLDDWFEMYNEPGRMLGLRPERGGTAKAMLAFAADGVVAGMGWRAEPEASAPHGLRGHGMAIRR